MFEAHIHTLYTGLLQLSQDAAAVPHIAAAAAAAVDTTALLASA